MTDQTFGLAELYSQTSTVWFGPNKNLEEKDGQRLLLYYVSLIRACNKVLYQLVYIGKKFVFLKRTFVFNKPVGPNNVKKMFCLLCDFKILLTVITAKQATT